MNHIYNFPVSGDMEIVERIQNQVRSIYQYIEFCDRHDSAKHRDGRSSIFLSVS